MGRSAIAVMSERFGHRPAPTVGTACEAPVHVVTCVRDGFDPYRWVMDTRNPVLAREATQYATFGKQSAAAQTATPEQLQEMYDAPTAPGRVGRVVDGDRALTI